MLSVIGVMSPSITNSSTNERSTTIIEYEGSNFLRARLVLATLSGRAIRIKKIRTREDNPGLNEAEASLIRLFDKISNGCKFEVSETGTTLCYQPGLLTGGQVEHDCSLERGIGYYLEPLMSLGAFCKSPLNVTLRGVTNNQQDPTPDLLKQSSLPILKRFFLVDDGLELKIQKRGSAPGGGGQVLFRCPIRRALRAQQFIDQGKIKRIRGVAWATRVSPAVANRMIESSKGILLKFIPDVYIYADHFTGAKSGKSPGFGLTLTAETTTGVFLNAEVSSNPVSSEIKKEPTVPEDLGVSGAHALLEEIYRGGCVDSTSQTLFLLLAAMGPRDVSKVVLGPLSNYTVHFLRHLKDFFQLVYKLETFNALNSTETTENEIDEDELQMGVNKVVATCVGVGYTNLSKRTT